NGGRSGARRRPYAGLAARRLAAGCGGDSAVDRRRRLGCEYFRVRGRRALRLPRSAAATRWLDTGRSAAQRRRRGHAPDPPDAAGEGGHQMNPTRLWLLWAVAILGSALALAMAAPGAAGAHTAAQRE